MGERTVRSITWTHNGTTHTSPVLATAQDFTLTTENGHYHAVRHKTPGAPMDPDMISRLRGQAQLWRSMVEAGNDERAKLNQLIVEAKENGHSFSQIREATGLGTGTIQTILLKAGYRF